MSDEDTMRSDISLGVCPACGHHGFRIGPRSGEGLNIACMRCDVRFNIINVGWEGVRFAERIEPPSDKWHGTHS